jgi:putative transposase
MPLPKRKTGTLWMFSSFTIGRKLRVLVDTFSRFSPAVEPRFNFCGADVVEVFERVGRQGGFPA